jgi:DNA-binding response OmpR family regulator/signal transduction histidine kinase
MQVLVVEDDPSVSAALAQVLRSAGHECDVTSRGSDALLRVHRNDAVLLDLGLEDMDGFEVLHRLRKVTSIPVLVVTARGEERHVVRGLRLGADDYLVKPVRMQELIARLDAARVRKRDTDPAPERVEVGELTIDMRSRSLSRAGVPVSLTRTEFDVLAVLARRPGEPRSHPGCRVGRRVRGRLALPRCPRHAVAGEDRRTGPDLDRARLRVPPGHQRCRSWPLMYTRILAAFVVAIVVAVAALSLPLLDLTSRERTAQLVLQRGVAMDTLTALARGSVEDGEASRVLLDYLARHREVYGEEAAIIDAAGNVVAATGDPAEVEIALELLGRQATADPLSSQLDTVWPWSPETVLVSAPVDVGDDLSGGLALLHVDQSDAIADLRTAWALLALAAVIALFVSVAAARQASRWITRPLHVLEDEVKQMGTRPRPAAVFLGPPELRRLASTVHDMSVQVATSLRQQSDLVASTSHQLRNPLAALRLRLDLLGESTPGPDENLAAANGELDRLSHTVDRILQLAEVEHRLADTGAAGPRLSTIIRPPEVVKRWRAPVQRAGLRILSTSARGVRVPLEQSDATALFDTLIVNAMTYAGRGATIHIDGFVSGGRVVLTVSDDGPGLPTEDLAQVGRRFWRSPTHTSIPGTGLGLAFVHDVTESSGGEMTISASDRGGLSIRLEFPEVVP